MTPTEQRVAHSPGPWHGADKRQRDATYAICQSGYRVASVHLRDNTRPPFTPDVEQDANARLIAAAPTMYQELDLAADTFRDFSNVLRAIGKDVMAAAADVAERHIREYLATIANTENAELATGETRA